MNLCNLPEAEQAAIQKDKELWYEAHIKITTCQRDDVLRWLETLPEDEKKDMRRRLNTIHQRLKNNYQEATKRMQKGLAA